MTEPDAPGSNRPRRTDAETADDGRDAAGESSAPSRRAVLQGLAASAGVATAGCLLLGRTDESPEATEPSPAADEEPATTPSGADAEPARDPAAEPPYEMRDPQLETPWTAVVSPEDPRPEYPRPQMVREAWANLNGVWQFAPAEAGETPPFGTDLPEGVLVPFPIESGLSGIKRYEPRMWYRRTFTVPEDWAVGAGGGRLLLHFERVDWEATVYVNGQRVTAHRGGYDHFAADVTEALDGPGPQELVVGVYDPTGTNNEPRGTQPKGRQGVDGGVNRLWKRSVSGIWGTVWLEPVPRTYVADLEMTPDLDAEALRLTVRTEGPGDPTVEAVAREDGSVVGRVTGPADRPLELPVSDPRTWSPEDPFLHDLAVRLVGGGRVVDEVAGYFGMRSLGTRRYGKTSRVTLNGEPYYLLGTLDSGYWPDGLYTAPTDDAIRAHLAAQKELGFNAVRMHCKLEPRRWFYHADRLGLLVWQDVPNMDEDLPDPSLFPPLHDGTALENFRREVRAMVAGLDTHPSLAVWTPFNEGWGVDNDNLGFVREVTEMVADLDPERLVDANSGHNVGSNRDPGVGDFNDVHNYPELISPQPDPDRVSTLGEYTSPSLHRPANTHGRCGGTGSAEAFVRRYLDTVDRLRQFVEEDGLGGSVYTATTDLSGVCNGMVTYDRRVLKPAEAEDGVERVRRAHERLRATAERVADGGA